MRRALLMVWAVLIGFEPVLAEDMSANVGTTGFGFLKLSTAARPSALGGAFVAVRGDIAGVAWNPAVAATLHRRQVSFSYSDYLIDTQAGFLGLGWPMGDLGSIGFGVNYMSYGRMAKTNIDGDDIGTFNAGDVSFQWTFGRFVLKHLAVGVSLKGIYSKIDTYTSDAYAFDLGLFYDTPIKGLSLGASALNLGGVRQGYTSNRKDALPVNLKLGFCHYVAHLPLMLVGEWNDPNDNNPYYAIGGELSIAAMLFLRGGYHTVASDLDSGERAGWSVGGGLRWRVYRFDYAHSSFAALGNVHRISATGRF